MRVSLHPRLLSEFTIIYVFRHATLACYKALVKKNSKVSGVFTLLFCQADITIATTTACRTLGADGVNSGAFYAASILSHGFMADKRKLH
jgi:hypothetical protein